MRVGRRLMALLLEPQVRKHDLGQPSRHAIQPERFHRWPPYLGKRQRRQSSRDLPRQRWHPSKRNPSGEWRRRVWPRAPHIVARAGQLKHRVAVWACFSLSVAVHLSLLHSFTQRTPSSQREGLRSLTVRILPPQATVQLQSVDAVSTEIGGILSPAAPLLPAQPAEQPTFDTTTSEAAPKATAPEARGTDDDYLPRALLTIPPEPQGAVVLPSWSDPNEKPGKHVGTLVLYINAAGTVDQVIPEAPRLPPKLEDIAVETFRSVQFAPAQRHGYEVKSWIRVEVEFDNSPIPQSTTLLSP